MNFYLILLLDSLILQPIRCILGFILRFFWHPPYSNSPTMILPIKELSAIAKDRLASLNRDVYGKGGDSAKFLGMLFFATGKEEDWQNVITLVNEDGSLRRNLTSPYDKNNPPFSGDMLSGFILALYKRLPAINAEERKLLSSLWHRTTWTGFPLLIAHPYTGKGIGERGHIWRPWWVMGSEDVLSALLWFYLGFKITGYKKYLVAYYVTLFLQLPSLVCGCADAQIWLKNVYATAWHNTHSKVLCFYVGYKLTGNYFFKNALKQAYHRHAVYNADICLLAGQVLRIPGYEALAQALVSDATQKGIFTCPADKKYVSLIWPPERVQRSSKIVLPSARGSDYVWERSPIKGSLLSDSYRQEMGLDVVFPTLLLADSQNWGEQR